MDALENLVGDMTLSDLSCRTGRSVSEIVEYAVRTGARAGSNGVTRKRNPTAPSESKAGTASTQAKDRTVNTRTSAGRERFDDAVLEVVHRARRRIGAVEVRKQVGGTPQQVRTALHRLIERKAIVAEGQARATTYRAT